MVDYSVNRSGNKKALTGIKPQDRFNSEFDKQYAQPLCQTHLNLINRKKTQFVGVKTLNSSLRFIAKAISNKGLY
jgi:hypothetical protein